MFTCKRCDIVTKDGVTCSQCMEQFDFTCAGISEIGWKKLGERKNTWKCSSCKSLAIAGPHTGCLKTPSTDSETILAEIKRLSTQMEALPVLISSVKAIQAELSELKAIRAEFSDIKTSLEFVHDTMEGLTCKITTMEQEIESMKITKEQITILQQRVEKIENSYSESEQRSRLNNIEIKGVPMSNSENLFNIIGKIGETIGCRIPKEQINYIARVPTRNDKQNKNIICSVHNCYTRNDFVAAAKKKKNLCAKDLGLQSANRIYVNDHLTLENKTLLNKTKVRAKERGFEYVWVKSCKIWIRKNLTSPKQQIRTERDLKKFLG